MKASHKFLCAAWLVICVYLAAGLIQGIYRSHSQPFWLGLDLFYVLLYLAGAVASYLALSGRKRAGIIAGIVALLTLIGSVTGFFAFFNSLPYSFVGITFDIFAVVSVAVLLRARPLMTA